MGDNDEERLPFFRRTYTLPQIVSMERYVFGIIADLKEVGHRKHDLRSSLGLPAGKKDSDYPARRRRYLAEAELVKANKEQMALRTELASIGVRLLSIRRGEVHFPARVDRRDAYFIWYAGRTRPSHFRFLGEDLIQPIPDRWYLPTLPGRKRFMEK